MIKDGSLIRVVQVQPEMSTCQLSDLAHESYFEQMTGTVEQFADKEGNIDLDQLAAHVDVFWPIQKGHSVMQVPSEERDGRDRVEELYGRTLDDSLSNEERRFMYAEMVRQTNEFLLEHATGYFASAMLFQRGYAQFRLEQYRDAIDTFELFLRRYPFSASADGARAMNRQGAEGIELRLGRMGHARLPRAVNGLFTVEFDQRMLARLPHSWPSRIEECFLAGGWDLAFWMAG